MREIPDFGSVNKRWAAHGNYSNAATLEARCNESYVAHFERSAWAVALVQECRWMEALYEAGIFPV